MNSRQLRWFYLILLALIWGSSFILMKKALVGLSPVQVGALRMIFTGITLFVIGFGALREIKKPDYPYIFWTAVLGTFFPVFLFAYAIQHIDSAIASILNSVTPLLTLIIGAVLYGFTFLRSQVLGILIGLAGAAFLILKGAQINTDQNYAYAVLVIIASVGYAFNVNILKRHLGHLSALSVTTATFALLFIPALIVLAFTGFFTMSYTDTTVTSLCYLVVLAVFGTAFAKTLFNKLVQISSPIFSSSVTYLIPMVAVFWGVLDGEKISPDQILAGGVILLGIYLSNKGKG